VPRFQSRSRTRSRTLAFRLLVSAVVLLPLVGACGAFEDATAGDPAAPTPAAEQIVPPDEAAERVADGAVLLDVRTTEEFADGHLDGARNIDLESEDFRDRAERLDADASYVVYCATGNRAGQAIAIMNDLGIDDAVNAGGYDDLRGVLG
jgi:rhodanese-related sulfurtransferase